MIDYEEREVHYTPVKIKLSVIKDEVDWEDLPMTTGAFSVSVVKKSGEVITLPEIPGSLLNVFGAINELDVENCQVANVVQTKTIFD